MTRTRWFLLAAILILAILGIWLWWVRPRTVDMAAYAPSDSLLYLESNSPADVVGALTRTDAWKLVDDLTGNQRKGDAHPWSMKFVKWTGIGPINSVIFARSQLAVVVTDLGIAQDEESLTIKPEGALLVETHTAESRIRPAVEQAIKKFAETAYGQPTLRRTTLDGVEFIEWSAPGGTRQVVATLAGSLVIVGNTERAVQKTLSVVLGHQPSLKADPDLHRLRFDLQAGQALAFGYVPAKDSGRLLSVALPMVFGRAPSNTEFERLINSASSKIISSLAWSSTSFGQSIEDRYRVNLQPGVVAKLKEGFSCSQSGIPSQPVLPANFLSATYYGFQSPTMAWQGMKTSVSSQVDALSAVLFSALLKSALLPYGINEPDKFLSLIDGPVLTARLDPDESGSVLVAKIRDQAAMRELLTHEMAFHLSEPKQNAEAFDDSEKEFSARFVGGFVVIGSELEVARYVDQLISNLAASKVPTSLPTPLSQQACVLTYASDTERIRAFVSTIILAGGRAVSWSDQSEAFLRSLPYSATETSLEENGIERITRSSLGQFSTLLPLVFPQPPTTNENSRR